MITSSIESKDWSIEKMLTSFTTGMIGKRLGKGASKLASKASDKILSKSIGRISEVFSREFVDGIFDSEGDLIYSFKYASKSSFKSFSNSPLSQVLSEASLVIINKQSL